ncbi:MAG: outer membrane beta-barrel protein [Ferruginibacter sp.]
MRKIITLTAIIILSSFIAMAQKKEIATRFSAGPELGFATGTFSNGWGLGIGVSGQGEHFFQNNISGTALLGITSYVGKSIGSGIKNTSTTIVPLRIGARYYIADNFHVGAQIGVGFISYVTSTTAFAYSPQIGYNFKTKPGYSIDASFKYDGYSKSGGSLGAFGIRVAYIF